MSIILKHKTASTIAASTVHSCANLTTVTLYTSGFLKSQTNRLQQIQNCLVRPVVKAPKFSLVIPILRSSWGQCDGVSWSDGRRWHLVAASDCTSSRPLPAVRAATVGCVDRVWTEAPTVRRRRLSYHRIVIPLRWPCFTDGRRCRRQVGVRRSLEASSPSPESHISYFSLLTVSLLLGNFVAWRDECQLSLLWTSWLFTELL